SLRFRPPRSPPQPEHWWRPCPRFRWATAVRSAVVLSSEPWREGWSARLRLDDTSDRKGGPIEARREQCSRAMNCPRGGGQRVVINRIPEFEMATSLCFDAAEGAVRADAAPRAHRSTSLLADAARAESSYGSFEMDPAVTPAVPNRPKRVSIRDGPHC